MVRVNEAFKFKSPHSEEWIELKNPFLSHLLLCWLLIVVVASLSSSSSSYFSFYFLTTNNYNTSTSSYNNWYTTESRPSKPFLHTWNTAADFSLTLSRSLSQLEAQKVLSVKMTISIISTSASHQISMSSLPNAQVSCKIILILSSKWYPSEWASEDRGRLRIKRQTGSGKEVLLPGATCDHNHLYLRAQNAAGGSLKSENYDTQTRVRQWQSNKI